MAFKRRQKMSRSHSRSSFSRNAMRVHGRNMMSGNPMRGGIRL